MCFPRANYFTGPPFDGAHIYVTRPQRRNSLSLSPPLLLTSLMLRSSPACCFQICLPCGRLASLRQSLPALAGLRSVGQGPISRSFCDPHNFRAATPARSCNSLHSYSGTSEKVVCCFYTRFAHWKRQQPRGECASLLSCLAFASAAGWQAGESLLSATTTAHKPMNFCFLLLLPPPLHKCCCAFLLARSFARSLSRNEVRRACLSNCLSPSSSSARLFVCLLHCSLACSYTIQSECPLALPSDCRSLLPPPTSDWLKTHTAALLHTCQLK